jgi:hypothetical protein
MPKASKKYCKSTPISKMGFTQRASCKAQGLIPRTSKKNKGKLIKSPKYRLRSPGITSLDSHQMGNSLYSSGSKKSQIKTGYSDSSKAKMTLRNIKNKDLTYQKQIVNTMYNRAKFHKYQTQGMREAMKIFKDWLNKN